MVAESVNPVNESENSSHLLDEKTLRECEDIAVRALKESSTAASDALKPDLKLEGGESPEQILDELFLATELSHTIGYGGRLSPVLVNKEIELIENAGELGPTKWSPEQQSAHQNLLIKFVSTYAAENPSVLDDKTKVDKLDGLTEAEYAQSHKLYEIGNILASHRAGFMKQRFENGDGKVNPDVQNKIDAYLRSRSALYDIEMVAKYGGHLKQPRLVAAEAERAYRKTLAATGGERTVANLYEETAAVASFPSEVYETAAKMQAMFAQLSRPDDLENVKYQPPRLF